MKRFLRLLSLLGFLWFGVAEPRAQQPASENYRLAVVDFVALGPDSRSGATTLVGPIVGEATGFAASATQRIGVGFWAAATEANDRLADALTFDEVLNQTAVHGDTVEFHVTAPQLQPPVDYQILFPSSTAGVKHLPVEFQQISAYDALFRYTPGPDDLEPFNVIILAVGADGQRDLTEFTISPYPVLPAEEHLIQSTLPEPHADSRDYVATSDEASTTPEDFNGRSLATRKLAWVGKSLVVQKGHENRLADTYDYTGPLVGAQRIKTLAIFAEDVVMRDPVRLVGADVTVFARSFSAPGLDKPFGDAARVTIVTNTTEWLQPEALRMMLAHVRDGYLNAFSPDRVQGIRRTIADYLDEVQAVEASPRWASLSEAARTEFGQERSEMESLLWSLDRNLDIFGNPAGWVPNLSFEVNLSVFNSEIEQAIKTLYLTQWLSSVTENVQSRIAGMKESQKTLYVEVGKADTGLARLKDVDLPGLQSKAESLSAAIETLKQQITDREKELRDQAGAATSTAHKKKKKSWKKILSIASSVMQVFPIGQPILGAIGTGLSVVSRLDHKSFSSPLAILGTLSKFKGVAGAFSSANFTSSLTQAKDLLGGILKPLDPQSILSPTLPFQPGFMDYVKKVKDYYKGVKGSVDTVKTSIKSIRDAAKANGMGDQDGQALLAQQRAENPEFNAPVRTSDGRLNGLLDEVQKKFNEQRDLANEITEAIQLINQLTDQVTHGILTIDAVNQSLAKADGSFDPRTAAALKDMERRAQQRLLKYHYYMAKAYEARFQEPYNQPLDLAPLYNRLLALAKADPNGNGTLTRDQVAALAQIYNGAVSEVVERIVDKFNREGAGSRLSTSYRLTTDELAKLNRNEPLSVNFVDRCIVQRDQEGIVINNVTLAMSVGGTRLPNDTVRLQLKHSGVSKLKRGDRDWLFRHSSPSAESPFRREHSFNWELQFQSNTEKYVQKQPARDDFSLIKFLLELRGKPVEQNLTLFSRAGLWADFSLTRKDDPDVLAHYTIDDVRIEVDYDYRDQSRSYAVLDVEATDHAALRPLFVLDHPDRTARQHGIGRMSRTFDRGSRVSLSTPAVIGVWTFKEWRGCAGRSLPARVAPQAKNPKLSLLMEDNLALQAVYVSSDTDEDGLPDAYEQTNFGSLTQLGSGDFDNDGSSNLAEFFLGTDPRRSDADVGSIVVQVTVAGSGSDAAVALEWESRQGASYVVESVDSLGGVPVWRSGADPISATSTRTRVSLPAGQNQQFYRVRSQ